MFQKKLRGTGQGNLYLVAWFEGTPNYYGVTTDGGAESAVPFEVTALENYWTEAPRLMVGARAFQLRSIIRTITSAV